MSEKEKEIRFVQKESFGLWWDLTYKNVSKLLF